MTNPILFYPAFGSPFSYVAAQLIDDIGARHRRPVVWRPLRLSAVLQTYYPTGIAIPPQKMQYWHRDIARVCALRGLPFQRPPVIPPDCDAAYAACYALGRDDPAQVRRACLALFQAIWGQGLALVTADAVAEALAHFHLGRAEVLQAAADPYGRAEHQAAIRAAIDGGMIGAPWFVVDGESFWGHDQLPYLDQWLSRQAPPALD